MKRTQTLLSYRTIPDVKMYIYFYTCRISAGDILKLIGTRGSQHIWHAQELATSIIQYLTCCFFSPRKSN